jgi:hypothetical protein
VRLYQGPSRSFAFRLLDHLVGGQKNAIWYGDAKCIGRFEIDYQLEFGGLLGNSAGFAPFRIRATYAFIQKQAFGGTAGMSGEATKAEASIRLRSPPHAHDALPQSHFLGIKPHRDRGDKSLKCSRLKQRRGSGQTINVNFS